MADLGTVVAHNYYRWYTKPLDIWFASGFTSVPGIVTRHVGPRKMWHTRVLPTWGYSPSEAPAIPINGVISGVVTEAGVPVPKCLVAGYFRRNMSLMYTTLTNEDGEFTFTDLDPTNPAAYFAVAIDPEGGVQYNALIFDRLTAV